MGDITSEIIKNMYIFEIATSYLSFIALCKLRAVHCSDYKFLRRLVTAIPFTERIARAVTVQLVTMNR